MSIDQEAFVKRALASLESARRELNYISADAVIAKLESPLRET